MKKTFETEGLAFRSALLKNPLKNFADSRKRLPLHEE